MSELLVVSAIAVVMMLVGVIYDFTTETEMEEMDDEF